MCFWRIQAFSLLTLSSDSTVQICHLLHSDINTFSAKDFHCSYNIPPRTVEERLWTNQNLILRTWLHMGISENQEIQARGHDIIKAIKRPSAKFWGQGLGSCISSVSVCGIIDFSSGRKYSGVCVMKTELFICFYSFCTMVMTQEEGSNNKCMRLKFVSWVC